MNPSRDTDGADALAPFYAALERYFEAEDQVLADMQARIDRLSDDLYERLMNSVQDYLCDNAEWNIAAKIDAAERQAAYDREALRVERETKDALLGALFATRDKLSGVLSQFDHAGCTCTFPSEDCCSYAGGEAAIAKANAAIAKATGAA